MEDLLRKVHRSDLLDPHKWFQKYTDICQAAATLEPYVEEYWTSVEKQQELKHWLEIFFMLHAYALENILKGALVAQDNDQVAACLDGGGRLPKRVSGHDLGRLWKECGCCTLSADERSLLARMERCAVWQARYPSPLAAGNIRLAEASWDGGKGIITSMFASNDLAGIREIHHRAQEKYQEITSGC